MGPSYLPQLGPGRLQIIITHASCAWMYIHNAPR